MAWTASGMFTVTIADYLGGVIANTGAGAADLDAAGALKLALYDNSITPNFEAAAASAAYGAGVWASTGDQDGSNGGGGAQVFHSAGSQWTQGGVTLTTPAISRPGAGVVMFDADNVASQNACTMSFIYGGLLYIDALTTPVADQGLLAVYFGGTAYSVTNGTFTVQWNVSGIFRLTVA